LSALNSTSLSLVTWFLPRFIRFIKVDTTGIKAQQDECIYKVGSLDISASRNVLP
jgi:hypothetical protein